MPTLYIVYTTLHITREKQLTYATEHVTSYIQSMSIRDNYERYRACQ